MLTLSGHILKIYQNSLLFILICLSGLCLQGCGQKEKQKGTLKINFQQGEPYSIHPHFMVDSKSATIIEALFEGLTRINLQGEVELALAKKYIVSECKKKYIFTLRDSYWSNGEKVSADHFVQAWKSAFNPNSRCFHAKRFFLIKNAEKAFKNELPVDEVGIKIIDSQTIAVELEYPAPYFLELLSQPFYFPLYDIKEKEPIVFNGAFILKSWEKNHLIELSANPKYWDVENVKLEKVEIFMIQDPRTAFSLFEKGELHFIGDPLGSLPNEVLASKEISKRIVHKRISDVYWLFCHVNDPLLHSKKIRKALAMAIDRKVICDHIQLGQIPTKSILPTSFSGIDPETYLPELKHREMRALFHEGIKDLGISKENYTLTLSYKNDFLEEKLAEFIQGSWKKIFSIQVHLRKVDWHHLLDSARKKNYQIAAVPISAVFEDPMSFIDRFEESSYNYSGWESPSYKKWFLLGQKEPDEKKRKEFLAEAEAILLDELPVIPISQQSCQYLIHDSLHNFLVTNLSEANFRYAYFSK